MKKNNFLMGILLFAVALLAACSTPTQATLTGDQKTQVAQTVTSFALQNQPTATITSLPTSTNTPTALPSSTPTPSPTPSSIGPDNFDVDVNPLTGLKVSDPNLLNRRPVIIKVSNYPVEGRPHAGLSSADIVWEYYIGAGSNRFAALYYGQDNDHIGPVRSVRLVDPQLARLYQAVLGYSGGNQENVLPTVYELLGNRTMAEGICPGICDDGHHWVTTVFGDSAAMTRVFQERGVDEGIKPDLSGMLFDTTVPNGGQDGKAAWIKYTDYTTSEWVYDSASGKYLRWTDDPTQGYIMIPLVDRNTDQQLAFSNVIVLNATYTEYTTVLHDINVRGNTEGQKATVFRDGQAFEVLWKATNPEKPIQFFDQNGNLFPLKPGNSWMALMGTSSSETVDQGEWIFTFSIP